MHMCLKSKTGFGQTWSNDPFDDFKWKNFEFQDVRDHKDPNFLYRQFFHLRKFKWTIPTKSWISHKLYETVCENCGFSTTPSQYFVKYKNGLHIKRVSWWVEKYWYSRRSQSRPPRVLKSGAWLWILSKFKNEWFKLFQVKSWPLDQM